MLDICPIKILPHLHTIFACPKIHQSHPNQIHCFYFCRVCRVCGVCGVCVDFVCGTYSRVCDCCDYTNIVFCGVFVVFCFTTMCQKIKNY